MADLAVATFAGSAGSATIGDPDTGAAQAAQGVIAVGVR
jgi:hypothetical protein